MVVVSLVWLVELVCDLLDWCLSLFIGDVVWSAFGFGLLVCSLWAGAIFVGLLLFWCLFDSGCFEVVLLRLFVWYLVVVLRFLWLWYDVVFRVAARGWVWCCLLGARGGFCVLIVVFRWVVCLLV